MRTVLMTWRSWMRQLDECWYHHCSHRHHEEKEDWNKEEGQYKNKGKS